MLWVAIIFVVGFVSQILFRRVTLSDRWIAVFLWKEKPYCARCKAWRGVKLRGSCTAYHWEGKWEDPENPNKPVLLCDLCAEEHYEYWDDMWQEYNRGRL